MKRFLLAAFLLLAALWSTGAQEPEKKRFVLYAQLLEETPVELSDGAKWVMDKGDCFPVYMFKEQQTKVVLQLASATFWTDAKRVRILKAADEGKALESYRRNVDSYLKSQSKKWREGAKKE